MRRVLARIAFFGALLALAPVATADDRPKQETAQTFVVTCKLVQPKQKSAWREPGLVVTTVPAGKTTRIPMRLHAEDLPGGGAAEVEELRFIVPGTDGSETVPIGHQIQVKAEQAEPDRVRLDAAVEFRGVERKGEDEFRVTGQHGRFVGELTLGKPALVVLETDDRGEPKHWAEFVVRFADEQADAKSQASSRVYSVAYSVAGLVGVAKKPKPGKRPGLDFAPLIKKIEAEVAPKTWAAAGGEGKLQPFARNASLVAIQTSAVHEELSEFLDRLLDDEEAAQPALFPQQ